MSSASPTTDIVANIPLPKRARDMVKGTERRPPRPLFDAFWREGELAMLFGEPNEGKSLLAVQIADAIARGEDPMHSAQCKMHNLGRKKRQKVLYIDLVLSKKQFSERYSGYKFAKALFRETPADGKDLFAMVKTMVAAYGFTAVIIDDLTLVSRTANGTFEALTLMHKLRQLTLDTGASVLVLADTYPFVYENQSPERGLRRSRILCGVADSVFALYDGCVVQTRSRSGEKVWTLSNKLRYTIAELDSGLLGLEFAPPKTDFRTRSQIVDIKRMHDGTDGSPPYEGGVASASDDGVVHCVKTEGVDDDAENHPTAKAAPLLRKEGSLLSARRKGGMTFREIADELKISKTQAQRLYHQWTPEIEAAVTQDDREFEEEEAYDAELDEWTASGGKIMWSEKEDRWVKAPKEIEN